MEQAISGQDDTINSDGSIIILVDDQDVIVGYKQRGKISQLDIYRVTALWITNSRGDILLAQRSFAKKHDPGKWGPAAAGTVERAETYDQNVIKEAKEELGLFGIAPHSGPKFRMRGNHNYFCQWYYLVLDRPAEAFKTERAAIGQVRWFTRQELELDLKDHPERYLDGLDWALHNLWPTAGECVSRGR